jgi:FMN-dependent NADH-azoreductase
MIIMQQPTRILRLDASASADTSISMQLGDRLIERLREAHGDIEVEQRDLNHGLSFIDSDWIAANLAASESRTVEQRERLALSDALIDELRRADRIVLTTPMYNFGIPSTLKAWIDLIARAGVTFRYTENGPVGLLVNKRIDIVITTGGAPLESPVDFVSGYLRQVFRFIGIEEINIIGADRMNVDADASVNQALAQIAQQDSSQETAREVA